jgi:nucleotide-binding universal stress UspA family protein
VDESETTMKMMVAYDARVEAKEALRIAKRHAEAFNASVDIVTSMLLADDNNQEKVDETKQSLEYAKTLLDVDKVSCSTHLLIRGLGIGEDLVKYAIENEIDEIFVGVKKKSKVGKLLLGSTAQHLILKAPCPVVTVRII